MTTKPTTPYPQDEPLGQGDYQVAQGECLESIAAACGLSPETVWSHAKNAALKQARQSYNTLLPGDRLTLPPSEGPIFELATDKRHRVVLRFPTTTVRVSVLEEGIALSAQPFSVYHKGKLLASGQTDSDGIAEWKIPLGIGQLDLIVAGELYPLELRELNPPKSPSGVQQRLKNLGYEPGDIDGIFGPRSEQALRCFQAEHDREPTGELDDATLAALRTAHGS